MTNPDFESKHPRVAGGSNAGQFAVKQHAEADLGAIDLGTQSESSSRDAAFAQKHLAYRFDMLARDVHRHLADTPEPGGHADVEDVIELIDTLQTARGKRPLTWREFGLVGNWEELQRRHDRSGSTTSLPDALRSLDLSHRANVRWM